MAFSVGRSKSSSASAAKQVESKYHVTTDFPDLGLHYAAVTGNVGLVLYALTHGQAQNSVLHGLLPLHAACSGGSEQCVRMLLDRGADVNAPRLPKRYSGEQSKIGVSVGYAGSTPLHFAAANGHNHIVRLLLSKGAIHNKTDKHGLTPEDLALDNGHDDVVQTLRAWDTLTRRLQEEAMEEEDGEDEYRRLEPLRIQTKDVKKNNVMKGLDNLMGGATSRGRKGRLPVTLEPPSPVASSSSNYYNPPFSPSDSTLSFSPIMSSSPRTASPQRKGSMDSMQQQHLTALPSHLSEREAKQRRPSLPSIFEKATHRNLNNSNTPLASSSASLRRPSSNSRIHPFRTSTHSDGSSIYKDDRSDTASLSSRITKTSNKSLMKLFSRNHHHSRSREDESPSPVSDSPSPPPSVNLPLVEMGLDDIGDIGNTVDYIRRASTDVHSAPSSRNGSLDLQRSFSVLSRKGNNNPIYSNVSRNGSTSTVSRFEGSTPPSVPLQHASSREDLGKGIPGAWKGSPLSTEWPDNQGRKVAPIDFDETNGEYDVTLTNHDLPTVDSGPSDAEGGLSPLSPHPFQNPTGGWLSSKSPHQHRAVSAQESTRPQSASSSNGSSLRKVASANLRRGSESGGSGLRFLTGTERQHDGEGADSIGDSVHWSHSKKNGGGNRSRGASFTSTVSSSVLSYSPRTSPTSTPPMDADRDTMEHHSELDKKRSHNGGGRSRNTSVSSMVSDFSNGRGTVSTIPTTPSLLSSGALSTSSSGVPTIPTVPEHGRSSLTVTTTSLPETTHRISTHDEAKELKQAAERQILNRDRSSSASTVSLAQQLAAYGESLAIEREFANRSVSGSGGSGRPRSSKKHKGKSSSSTSIVPDMPSSSTSIKKPNYHHDHHQHHSILVSERNVGEVASIRSSTTARSKGSAEGKDAKGPKPVVFGGPPVPSILDQIQKPKVVPFDPASVTAPHKSNRHIPAPLITVEAPSSGSLPNISRIYSDRAEAMRKKGLSVSSSISSSPLATNRPDMIVIVPPKATPTPASSSIATPTEYHNNTLNVVSPATSTSVSPDRTPVVSASSSKLKAASPANLVPPSNTGRASSSHSRDPSPAPTFEVLKKSEEQRVVSDPKEGLIGLGLGVGNVVDDLYSPTLAKAKKGWANKLGLKK